MRRILLLLLCLSLLLSGCGKLEDSTPYDTLDELREYYGTEEVEEEIPLTTFTLPYCSGETWDPLTCPDGVQRTAASLIYETLYRLDETFTPQPLLVERADYDAEKFVYTLHLRSGVLFSDGSAMTAEDVAASLLRATQSQRYGPRLWQVRTVLVRGNTVEVTLSEDSRGFPALLDIPVIKAGTETQTIPVGTGPYLPNTDMTALCPNTCWWQKKSLPFDTIALLRYKSEEAAAYAFASHDVHLFVYDLLSDISLASASNDNATVAETAVMHYLGFNLSKHYLTDPALRRAVSAAIDREEIVSAALSGHAVATQFPVHPSSPLYPRTLEINPSPSAVYEALAQHELSDGEWKYQLRLLVNDDSSFKVAAAQRIAETLNRYDFEVTVLALPWEDFLYVLEQGNYDLYYGQCKLSADWDATPLLGEGCTLNYGGYASEVTNTLLAAYRSAQPDTRAAAMEALCRHLQEESPIVPLYFERVDVLLSRGAVDTITPTATEPFYGLEHWKVNWGDAPASE
ncbi:MAG: ABC transporter substrate-binding protein [Oscillospiraceae bacterium]|nr:ABC transporter substrate-binding protein [Oscillospiraceae bacterium]